MRTAFAILFLALVAQVNAATNVAASASLADVQTAITASTNGDTVLIPAATATWASELNLTIAIALIGAGTNSTKITVGANALNVTLTTNRPVRISGITFTNTTAFPTVTFAGSSATGAGTPISSFRVDRCRFVNGKRAVYATGLAYGLVDYNTFIDCDIGVGMTGDDNQAKSRALSLGTTNCVCIEDNVFFLTTATELNEQVYHQDAPRSMVRYNTFDSRQSVAPCNVFDAHGNGNYYTGTNSYDVRGTISSEVYGNMILVSNAYRTFHLRGGTFLIWGNIETTTQGTPQFFNLTEEESWQTAIFTPLATNWPAQDQITNSFFWLNILNGTEVSGVTLSYTNDIPFIKSARDYWFEPPNTTNGSPAGVYAGYVPLSYPHPLAAAEIPYASSRLTGSFVITGNFNRR